MVRCPRLYTQMPLAVCVIGLPQWLQTATRQCLPSLVVTVLTGIAFHTKQSVVIPTNFSRRIDLQATSKPPRIPYRCPLSLNTAQATMREEAPYHTHHSSPQT